MLRMAPNPASTNPIHLPQCNSNFFLPFQQPSLRIKRHNSCLSAPSSLPLRDELMHEQPPKKSRSDDRDGDSFTFPSFPSFQRSTPKRGMIDLTELTELTELTDNTPKRLKSSHHQNSEEIQHKNALSEVFTTDSLDIIPSPQPQQQQQQQHHHHHQMLSLNRPLQALWPIEDLSKAIIPYQNPKILQMIQLQRQQQQQQQNKEEDDDVMIV